MYWEVCGNPDGKPAVCVHGGPGSGCDEGWRRFFDPEVYRVVLFDQRNCGRSLPSAAEPAVDLSANTTPHLIGDLERLRELLGVDAWLLFGGSWGATLALAYAQAHPERVTELVLHSIVTTSREEVAWVTRAMGRVFPEAWDRFRNHLPAADRDGDLAAGYARLLHDPDPAVVAAAAREWCRWEDTHVATVPGHEPDPAFDDPAFRLVFARLVTHYWANAGFLGEGRPLLDGVHRIAHVPAVLIHGALDVSSPAETAYRLAQGWPAAELLLFGGAGHGTAHRAAAEAALAAIAWFGAG
ncbi:prolyl aminopeptidase [Actinocorallia lasiicapitis]